MKKKMVLLFVSLIFSYGVTQAAEISRSIFTTDINNTEPVDELSEVTVEHTRVFYFTEILGLNGHAITHRWEYNGQVLAEVALQVKSDRWRTWSSKNMLSSWLGNWKVSVIDEGGNILQVSEFNYIVKPIEVTLPVIEKENIKQSIE